MSEHLCVCVCVRTYVCVCVRLGSTAGKPSSSAVVYSKAPSQWRPCTMRQLCVLKHVCKRVYVQEWKWDRVGMMTDGNVIHPLIINMPHLYSAWHTAINTLTEPLTHKVARTHARFHTQIKTGWRNLLFLSMLCKYLVEHMLVQDTAWRCKSTRQCQPNNHLLQHQESILVCRNTKILRGLFLASSVTAM